MGFATLDRPHAPSARAATRVGRHRVIHDGGKPPVAKKRMFSGMRSIILLKCSDLTNGR
jgi:hypothetical protein